MQNQSLTELFSVNNLPPAAPEKPRKIRRAPNGYRVGEGHQRAILTDEQVVSMRKMHLQKLGGYKTLAVRFGVSESCARDICTFRTRPII
jgi:hypothetical protein